jgi:hypothetical protein
MPCCREHDKKVCILGMASLLPLSSAAMPAELQAGLDQVFRALLKLLVSFKEQHARGFLTFNKKVNVSFREHII